MRPSRRPVSMACSCHSPSSRPISGRRSMRCARPPASWTKAVPWSDIGDAIARADLVVDCTPIGLDPDAEAAFVDAIPLDRLPRGAAVATLVYHRSTLLVERAAARGFRTLDGS